MWPDDSLTLRLRSLATFQVFAVHRSLEAVFNSDDSAATDAELDVMAFGLGAEILAKSLGLEISAREILPQRGDPEDYADLIANGVLGDQRLPSLINEYFGQSASDHFDLTRSFAGVFTLASLFREPLTWQRGKSREAVRMSQQREIAIEACKSVGARAYDKWPIGALYAFDEAASFAISELVRLLRTKRWQRVTFENLFTAAISVQTQLVPHFPDVDRQLARTRAIMSELKSCPPGAADWRRYEDICIKALQMLFVPPFRRVTVQRLTDRRDERRDAVLSNTVRSGFWDTMRVELDCRHVICEFKNVKQVGKKELTQIRVYLRKPTIGRLGLLFHRLPAGASARLARRIAFADDRAVILLIDDITLVRLLLGRVFLGSADYALEDLKMDFELHY